MKKFVTSILMIVLLAGCATIKDKLPKRKACTGENKTISDLICKK
tara:strand:+ start:891 stop:1025 length:135 start_codon:yes stop_codon:yes gene_type:complete